MKASNASAIETRLIDEVSACFADPEAFVLMAFPWGSGDLRDMEGPDDWQRDILRAIGNGVLTASEALRYATSSGHGVGKTALTAWLILWAMSTRPNLSGVVTANTKSQLETKTWRELALWHKRAINRHWFEWTATKFYHVEHPDTWFVAAVPWSKERSEAFAGQHAEHVLVIYDEASAVDDAIWEVSEGAMTTPGAMWFVFGNPTRNTGRFRECWGKFRHRWNVRKVDSRNALMANKAQLQQWVDDYGEDSDFVRIRVRGEFPRASATQFIPGDLVDNAKRRQAAGFGPVVLGVDVARFGDDQTVIVRRQGDRLDILARYRGLDTMQTAARVAEIMQAQKAHGVFIDGVGVGGGVVDRLRQLQHKVTDVNGGQRPSDPTKYRNLRAECWGKMRDWLNHGCLPDDDELSGDLIGPEYGFDEMNRIQIEKKEDMKKRGLASPDTADALALTFAMPVNVVEERMGRRTSQGENSWMGS